MIKAYLELLIVSLMFGMFFLLFLTFMKAYFFLGQFVTVYVNLVGEADFEFCLMWFFLVLFFGFVLFKGYEFFMVVRK